MRKLAILFAILFLPVAFQADVQDASGLSCNLLFNPFAGFEKAVVVKTVMLYDDNMNPMFQLKAGTVGSVSDFAFEKGGKCWLDGVWLFPGRDARERQTANGIVVTGPVSAPYRNVIPSRRMPCADWGKYFDSGGSDAIIISWEGAYKYSSPDEMPPADEQDGVPDSEIGDFVKAESYQLKTIDGKTYCILRTADGSYRFAGTAEYGNMYIHPADMEWYVEKADGGNSGGNGGNGETGNPSVELVGRYCERIGGKIWINDRCTLERAFQVIRNGDILVLSKPGIYNGGFSTDKSFVITSPFLNFENPENYVIKADDVAFRSDGEVSIRGIKVIAPTVFKGKSVSFYQSIAESSGTAFDAENVHVASSNIFARDGIRAKTAVIMSSAIVSNNGEGRGIDAENIVMEGSLVYGFKECVNGGSLNIGSSTFQKCGNSEGYAVKGSGTVSSSLFFKNRIGIEGGGIVSYHNVFMGNDIGVRGEPEIRESSFYHNGRNCEPASGKCRDRCKRHSKLLFLSFNGFKTSECPLPEASIRMGSGDELRIDTDVKAVPMLTENGIFAISLESGGKIRGYGGRLYVPFSSSGIYLENGEVEGLSIHGEALTTPDDRLEVGTTVYPENGFRHYGIVAPANGNQNAIRNTGIYNFAYGIYVAPSGSDASGELLLDDVRMSDNYADMVLNTPNRVLAESLYAGKSAHAIAMLSGTLLLRGGNTASEVDDSWDGILVHAFSPVNVEVSDSTIQYNVNGINLEEYPGGSSITIRKNRIENNNVGIVGKGDAVILEGNTFASNKKDCEGIGC